MVNNNAANACRISIQEFTINLLIAFLFSLLGCSSDNNPTGPPGEDFKYPLTSGSQWQYSRTFKQFNVRGDSAQVAQFDTTISSNIVWEVLGPDTLAELPSPLSVIVLKETMTTSDGMPFTSENYYRNEESGLFLHAHKGAASTLLKSSPAQLKFAGRSFNNTREILNFVEKIILQNGVTGDSLIIENPPLKSLQYPLEIGVSWTVSSSPFEVEKSVVGQENVTVPAGEFDCLKIQLNNEIDTSIEFFDFIGTDGLVLRTVLVRDIIMTSPDNPDGTGIIFDVRDEMQLIALDLKK